MPNLPGIVSVKSYSSTTDVRALSPAVWASCPVMGNITSPPGSLVYTTFDHGLVDLVQITDASTGVCASLLASSTASTTFFPVDHTVQLSTSTGANSYAAVHGQPLGNVVPGGQGIWFEASVGPTSSTGTQSLFIGLVSGAVSLSTGGAIRVNSITKSSNALQAGGYIGFWTRGSTPNNCDAIYTSSTGVVTTVLANVLTASTGNANPAFLQYTPVAPPGPWNGSTTVKLGIAYLPQNNLIQYFVNGNLVASAGVTTAAFDTVDDLAPIVQIDGGSVFANVDFVAAAAQWALA